VILFERESAAEYLPGTIPVFLGRTPRGRWRQWLSLAEVEVMTGEVEEVTGSGVKLDGGTYEADAVVAAPGLTLDYARVPNLPNVHAFWDPAGAEAASDAVREFRGGTVAVVVSSLPYRSPLLRRLPGEGPLVEVSPRFESAEPGLFVVGDAAMAPLPRAADAAAAEGRTAADAVLEGLGLSTEQEPHLPEPECYVGHGAGRYSRISLRYPDGLPPGGKAEVRIEGPSETFAAGFEASFDRWRELRGG